ncbi:MAG: transporter substrate-binding domain-containing protein [Aliarcobacter sp.]|nr:transporter substrate-binding domain-containing protein [Aliarcobacter sp.]
MKNILKTLFLISIIFYNNLFAMDKSKENNLEKVILQLEWKHQFEFAGFYAAIEKGYYKDIGIEIEIKEFEEGINISEEVLNGKATYGISSSALILEKLKNKPVVLIASYFKQNALALVTKPEIKSPSDLKNKKIMALDWEMGHTSLGVMLKDYGVEKDDYTLVNHNFNIDKFVNNQVDAMSIFITSQPFELDQLGIKYNILNPANFGIYSYDVELFTSEKVVNNNIEKVKKFVDATNKGWTYAFANKNEIIDLIYNKYSKRKTKEALLYEANKTEELFKTNVFKIGAITPELIKLNADMYSNLGLVNKDYDLNAIINDYFISNRKTNNINFTKEEKQYLKQNAKIKVHNESNWPPFNYRLNNKPIGFSIDYMNLLSSKIGLPIEYVSGFTWDEFLEKIKKNEIDVMLNIAKTEDREKYLAFTSSYAKNIDTIFVKKDANNLKNLDDFNGKTLAIIKGFYEEEILRKYYPKINFILVNDTLEALKKVVFNEANGALDSLAVGNYFMENNYISNLKPAFEVQDQRFNLDMHLAVNKNNMILKDILEKAKNEITQEEISNLNRKWVNTSEIKTQNYNNISLTKKEELYLINKSMITMCVDPHWEPFEKIDKNGKHLGISADIIKLISDKLNIKIKLIPTKTWEESLALSKNRKCDILSFLNETPKRKEWLNFTNKIFTDENVIIGRAETPLIKDLSKIKASIAIPKGTAMYEMIQNDFPNLVIIPTDSEEESFKYVEEKKADLTIRSLIVAAYTIKENGFFNLKILNQPNGYENYLKIGVQKNDLILVDILNKAIETISEDDINNIVNKWVAIKYEKGVDYTYLWISFGVIFILIIFLVYRQYLLKHTNDYLKSEVKKRTTQLEKSNLILKQKRNELHELNQNLEIKIKDEIEKNKIIQEKLFKADKMASMGEMISNIAHQWRQPLSVISTIATGVKLQKEINSLKDEDLMENMELINKNAQYLSKTIDDFRNFIKGNRNIQKYNLTNTIKNFTNIVESSIKNHNIKLILDLNNEIIVEGNPNELIQCLINLFNNSRDALEETNQNEPLIIISTQLDENSIQIKIKDNAGGIPENIMSKIYEPYFTTKHQSQGTGLGLHMTYRLITEAMNGRIETTNIKFEYENKFYKGVEFKITLDV